MDICFLKITKGICSEGRMDQVAVSKKEERKKIDVYNHDVIYVYPDCEDVHVHT